MTDPLHTDVHGVASLDGIWEFYPGPLALEDLDAAPPSPIRVPGLWEGEGHLELDGVAWYRRSFRLEEGGPHWTLRFGAVMDLAEVYLNGVLLGSHEVPFTPFEFDVSEALAAGENVLAVRVTDPPVGSAEHLRSPHGKQGWANNVFPSRPSLYMTYGGIWQPVTLRRHGAAVLRDVFVNADPENLVVRMEVGNVGTRPVLGRVILRVVGVLREVEVRLPGRAVRVVEVGVGPTAAPRWEPGHPVLHHAEVAVAVEDALSDERVVPFGLRTVRVEGSRMLVNGAPYRMKSVLVQGFRSDDLYAEGTRAEIVAEVEAAQRMGFNTLRLHIKAFDPRYLEVCDELGMLVHADIPVAEPIAHVDMGRETTLGARCRTAAVEQVRRDRNHPSIILWSAMNELCLDRLEARAWPAYERFARSLVAAIHGQDPTRPVIENDWVEPDPDHVFLGDVLTAHWYGRLHAEYLETIDRKCAEAASLRRPFFVTEFGDWGLPPMPRLPEPPFWDTREIYAAGLAATLWPGTVAEFVVETQRYQGLSDRFQIEVFRRHDHVGGYCLTELTDVPHELNGLLGLDRKAKDLAVQEITRANQTVLAMLKVGDLAVRAGDLLRAELYVSNDGPALQDVTVEARFSGVSGPVDIDYVLSLDTSTLPPARTEARFEDATRMICLGGLEGYRSAGPVKLAIPTPAVPGTHDLCLTVYAGGRRLSENRYPVHVVTHRQVATRIRVATGGLTAEVLEAMGAEVGERGPTVIPEGSLDREVAADMLRRLEAGGTVLLLAQPPSASLDGPFPFRLAPVATKWGSSVFHFTTDHGALPSLPRRAVLAGEDARVYADSVVVGIGPGIFPDDPVVIAYKPMPGAMTGTVVGAHRVGRGRLVFCQYRLTDGARGGEALSTALLGDLVRWAASPGPRMVRERLTKEDGRALSFYSWVEDA